MKQGRFQKVLVFVFGFFLIASVVHAAPEKTPARDPAVKSVRVFIALCDNKTQGVAPVPPAIGDGDRADTNLYWGCTEGFGSWFGKSKRWKQTKRAANPEPRILERRSYLHAGGKMTLQVEAWRGSDIKDCLAAFEACLAGGGHDLVAFIGHNGLMDFDLDLPAGKEGEAAKAAKKQSDAIVLCCKSRAWFGPRLKKIGVRPVLLTEQFMYPGAFILHDALDAWIAGKDRAAIRMAAARAYAGNQKISVKAAAGVFSKIEK